MFKVTTSGAAVFIQIIDGYPASVLSRRLQPVAALGRYVHEPSLAGVPKDHVSDAEGGGVVVQFDIILEMPTANEQIAESIQARNRLKPVPQVTWG